MRTLCLVGLLSLGAPVLAQEGGPTPQAAASADEVVVPGRRPENLRVEIERLEGAVYERWNALNSNDEFDIHCLKKEPTGSNIPLTRCAPNFVIQAEAQAAEDVLTGGRSRATTRNSSEHKILMEQKSRELTEEMQRIAREDEQLLRDLVRLDELRQLQSSGRRER